MKYGNYGSIGTLEGGLVRIGSNDEKDGPKVEAKHLAHPVELLIQQEHGIGE